MRLLVGGRIPRIRRKSLAGQFVLVLIGLQMMFLTSFFALDLPTGTGHNLLNVGRRTVITGVKLLPKPTQDVVRKTHPDWFHLTKPIRTTVYTPLAPMAIFLGYALGKPIGPISVVLFLLLGFLGPLVGINPFAGGGGLDYYLQPSFGYLMGLIGGSWLIGWVTEERRTSLAQLGGLVGGLWLPWVFEEARNLSWYPLPYDVLFSFILIGLGFPFRYLVNLLTAPDLALKSRGDRLVQQNMEELLG
jgi:hypothetical protein